MKFFSYIYNSLIWATALSIFCYAGWRMYFNVGYVFFGSFIVLSVLLCILAKKKNWDNAGLRGTLVGVISTILLGLIYMGPNFNSIMGAIASMIRWGLHARYLSLTLIKVVFLAVVVIGLAIIAAYEYKHPKDPYEGLNEDEKKMAKASRISRWATLGVLAVLVIICACIPPIREQMGYIFSKLTSGNVEYVKELILSYGPWAAAVSALLMVLQSLAAPIPAFLITFANAGIFGWWQGAILSWSSAMMGAAVCFFIARLLGRDAVAYFVSNTALKSVDKFFEKYGKNAILICRLLPFMSFDYISYAAGLTGMSFLDFFVATGIGQLPATIVYSYVGGMLTGSVKYVVTGLLVTFALFAMVFLARQMFKARNKDMMEESQDDSTRLEEMSGFND